MQRAISLRFDGIYHDSFEATLRLLCFTKEICNFFPIDDNGQKFFVCSTVQHNVRERVLKKAMTVEIVFFRMRKMRFSGVLMQTKTIVTRSQLFAWFLDKEITSSLPAVDFESILVLLFFLAIAVSTSFVILLMETIYIFTTLRKKQRGPVMYPFYK